MEEEMQEVISKKLKALREVVTEKQGSSSQVSFSVVYSACLNKPELLVIGIELIFFYLVLLKYWQVLHKYKMFSVQVIIYMCFAIGFNFKSLNL